MCGSMESLPNCVVFSEANVFILGNQLLESVEAMFPFTVKVKVVFIRLVVGGDSNSDVEVGKWWDLYDPLFRIITSNL